MRAKIGLETILTAAVVIFLLLACAWVFVGLRLDLWTPAQYSRYQWLASRLAIAPEFWHGRIKAEDDAGKIIKAWPPQMTHQYGPWTELDWVPLNSSKGASSSNMGIEALANNGKLVMAVSYADDEICERTFFNVLSPAAQANYQAWVQAYVEGRLNRSPNVIPTRAGKPRRHK
ncbi:MAG TPA: hypothetical protein VGI03_00050 [Verrucomicrobiae bacterium]|jgi:hypothetical protein